MTYTPQELTIRELMSLAEESSHPGAHLDSAHVGILARFGKDWRT